MQPVAHASQTGIAESGGRVAALHHRPNPSQPFQFMAHPIGPFYQHPVNRLLTYLLLAAGLVCGVFLALAMAGGALYLTGNLPLVCALALYVAVVFTMSHVFVDLTAHLLWPRRMAYGSRSVGGQWLVLFCGLALGLWLHQQAFGELMDLCAPESDSRLPLNLALVPLWCAALYACLLLVPMSSSGEAQETAAPPGHAQAAGVAGSSPRPRLTGQNRPAAMSFQVDGRQLVVPLEAISHVIIEDHYCRVFHRGGRGLASFLARETLSGLVSQAGTNRFLRIHRSHLVNPAHVTAFQRKGHGHYLLLGPEGTALPISRRRRKQVQQALAHILPL